MQDILKRNWDAIGKFCPSLYESLKSTYEKFSLEKMDYPNERFEWIPTNEGMNFRYTRKDPAVDILYHQPNPQKEAELILNSPQIAFSTFIIFWGIGLGHSLKRYLESRTQHNLVTCVFESNPQIFLRALCVQDFSQAFQDTSIFWIVTHDPSTASGSFHPIPNAFPTALGKILSVVQPAAIACDRSVYQLMENEVCRLITSGVAAFGDDIEDQFLGLANTVDNLAHAMRSPGFNRLENQFCGLPIVSVASGPSLDEHWETLEQIHGKIPIIACDSAYPSLVKRGIVPDFVTAIERVKLVERYFSEVRTPSQTTLISPSLLDPSALNAFQGVKALFSSRLNRYNSLFSLDELGILSPGHSAGNLNIAAACKMGFNTIILVGHNLGFQSQNYTTHHQGIGDDRQDPKSLDDLNKDYPVFKTLCQDETEEIYTSTLYEVFRIEIEQYIKGYPKNRFINTAKKGAKIHGSLTMSLQEAIETYLPTPFNIIEKKDKLLEAPHSEQKRNHCLKAREKTIETLKHLQRLQSDLAVFYPVFEQRLLKLERSSVSLDKLTDWLADVLNFKKTAIANLSLQDSFFSIFLPIHVQFEREFNAMPSRYQDDYSLKRDAFQAHSKKYFDIWLEYLSRVISEFEKANKVFESILASLPSKSSDSLSEPVETASLK